MRVRLGEHYILKHFNFMGKPRVQKQWGGEGGGNEERANVGGGGVKALLNICPMF